MQCHRFPRPVFGSTLRLVGCTDLAAGLTRLWLALLILGGALFAGGAGAKVRVEVSAQGGTSGGSASISVDIDEPTKPGPDGEGIDPFGPVPDLPQRILQDTMWIADWSFDGAGCVGTRLGEVRQPHPERRFQLLVGQRELRRHRRHRQQRRSAREARSRWARDGYGNNWDYSIILKYQGASTLTFDYLSDSEPGFDFVTVEADSAGASESLVDYCVDPGGTPEQYRVRPALGRRCAEHRDRRSDRPHRLRSPGDDPRGLHPLRSRTAATPTRTGSTRRRGTPVSSSTTSRSRGRSPTPRTSRAALDPNVSFANTAPATPFGEWARLYQHVTDNDKCTENTTCAWLCTRSGAHGVLPGHGVRPGLGGRPQLARRHHRQPVGEPGQHARARAERSSSYRPFPGNTTRWARSASNWQVRSKVRIDNTDTSMPGDSIDAVGPLGARQLVAARSTRFSWATTFADIVAVRRCGRHARSRCASASATGSTSPAANLPPATLNPGPGPYIDRVRIGRRVLSGPVFNPGIDTRYAGAGRVRDGAELDRPGRALLAGDRRSGAAVRSRWGPISAINDAQPEPGHR